MKDYKRLCHSKWRCNYHLVFIPKCRKKKIFGAIRTHLGKIFHELAKHKESEILEGHLKTDHVHMCISIRVPSVKLLDKAGPRGQQGTANRLLH